jgi:broad specificity phosphatase PhoE
MIVHLVTHAHTQQEPAVDSRSWILSAQGVAQAEALAHASFWPDVTALITSSEPKTRLTAQAVLARYRLPVAEDAHFDELFRSGWVDDYDAAVAQALNEPEQAFPGWETAKSAQQRAIEGLDGLVARFGSQEIAIIGHGLSFSLLRAWLLQQPTVNLQEWRSLPFGAWATVDMARRCIVRDFPFAAGKRSA